MADSVQAETTHRGRLFNVEVLSLAAEDGRLVRRDVVRHPGAVVIVPVLDDGRLLLIRNERIAVGERLWELPAGTLEPDETPAAAAARELEEETGYRTEDLRPLGSFYTSPGFCDELLRLFVARSLTFVGQNLDPGERIEAVPLAGDEVQAMIADGRIRDGKTIAGIHLWQTCGTGPGEGTS